jgi:hypothetical protein
MASTINASNSGFGGIVSTGDSSGQLQLQTAGTAALTIDTSQNATFAGTLTATGKLASSSMPTGSVVQVIYASTTTSFITASAAYVATPLTATITKSFSTSKILILASTNVQAYNNGGANAKAGGMIYDTTNSRQIIDFNSVNRDYLSGVAIHVSSPNLGLQAYDTNSGTGSRQYTFYIKNIDGTQSHLNIDSNGEATSTMVLMEVVG